MSYSNATVVVTVYRLSDDGLEVYYRLGHITHQLICSPETACKLLQELGFIIGFQFQGQFKPKVIASFKLKVQKWRDFVRIYRLTKEKATAIAEEHYSRFHNISDLLN